MKKIAVAFLFCLTSTIANAQSGQLPPGFITTNKPVLCGPADTIFKGLADQEIDEKPFKTSIVTGKQIGRAHV